MTDIEKTIYENELRQRRIPVLREMEQIWISYKKLTDNPTREGWKAYIELESNIDLSIYRDIIKEMENEAL